MNLAFDIKDHQITFSKQIVYHFYMGVILTLGYVLVSPYIIQAGYPGLTALLIVEISLLTPLALSHLFYTGHKINRKLSLRNVIAFNTKLPLKTTLLWSLIGVVACLAIYIPVYPIGIFLRQSVFGWLPEWYFNPGFGTDDATLVAKMFLVGILIDGLIGPTIEELFFRGYLLPRMSYLKNWAPIINGMFFGLYHFWQPHNFIGSMAIGMILSYIVWKKKSVHLGIIIHCSLNVIGALGGYLAASNGIIIGR